MEDIPNKSFRDLKTSLSEIQARQGRFTRSTLNRRSGVEETYVHIFLTDLCSEGILQAKIKIHCPNCDQDHGTFLSRSSIPTEREHCFCGATFNPSEKTNWTVVYEFQEEIDFFRTPRREFETFIDSAKELDSKYFLTKLEELEELENNSKRGQAFDYFIGLLFNQLPGVEVLIGKEVATGEIDVFVECLDSPEWLHRLVGDATLIENKWLNEPVQTREISVFHDKVKIATVTCKICYFISMNGFTSKRNMGAEQLIQSKYDPKMVGLVREDVARMAVEGTPAVILRDHVL